ncbi:MAG: N-acetylglucosamine-6-phosphate deacetylase [Planctomycetota bacterium]
MSGFIDLQVNGYFGVDFNADSLSEESIVKVCQQLRKDGTDRILATVITAPLEAMLKRIEQIASLIQGNPKIAAVIAGIHVEGPFLNAADGFVGAHPADATMDACSETVGRLIDAGQGTVKFVTLAPERDAGGQVTRKLTDLGITVAAGHSDATVDQLNAAIDQGLKLFTHLGNACPGMLPRHDNIIQRVLSLSDRLSISFIADGHHVPPMALKNYLQCVPSENVVIVTDAISAAGLGPGRYQLSGQVVEVDHHGAAWAACKTHFAGCASTFPQMVDVLKNQVGVSDHQIDQWMRVNPGRILRGND